MSIDETRPPRRRRSPEVARAEALVAARRLLLEDGPEAVTLKAVASAIGMSHPNLIHRFGSASGLQSALMADLVSELGAAIRTAAEEWRTSGAGGPSGLMEPVFKAFAEQGAGRLAAWIALSGDLTHLAPVHAALNELTGTLAEAFGDAPEVRRNLTHAVFLTTLVAFGDAVIGPPLREMLKLKTEAARDDFSEMLFGWVQRRS